MPLILERPVRIQEANGLARSQIAAWIPILDTGDCTLCP